MGDTIKSSESSEKYVRARAHLNKNFWLVLNKATSVVIDLIKHKAREMKLEVKGTIRFDEEVFKSCLEGGELKAKKAILDVENMLKSINLLHI